MSKCPYQQYDLWRVAEKRTICDLADSGPGLAKTQAGHLLAFFGTPHGTEQHDAMAEEVAALGPARVMMSRSTDGGLTWSEPLALPAPNGLDVHYGMPSCALALPSGRIVLVVRSHEHGADRDDWFFADHHAYHSDDDGQNWTIGKAIDRAPAVGNRAYAGGEIQQMGGILILGYQGTLSPEEHDANTYSAFFYRSYDEGLTWEDPSVLIRPQGHCKLAAEPSLAVLEDGRWIALVRYHGPEDCCRTVRIESSDEGRTWSELAHLFVGGMGCLRSLPGGGLMVSHVTTAGIVVRFSYDEGWNWTREVMAYDIWAGGHYRNGAAWNQSALVIDDDTILCGYTSVAPDDPNKDLYYGARKAEWGLAARIRFLRRQRDRSLTVPLEAGA
ncbi:MAG: sialidase family protein [Candidatus Latescibacterota bacterium]